MGPVDLEPADPPLPGAAGGGGEFLLNSGDLRNGERAGRARRIVKGNRARPDDLPAPLLVREIGAPLPGPGAARLPARVGDLDARDGTLAGHEFRAMRAKGAAWASDQMPVHPGEIRPRASTPVASTMTSPAPPTAREPR